ncbi:MAG: aminomethyl-transferring glycine dehydrogenase subunit GcvPA [Candidatus Diapherotrites archaeon]|nr:aminomethyl-transferring glycine dehydrogenase subunit GcvPA [Candidatus Diapherotrites archaeon]
MDYIPHTEKEIQEMLHTAGVSSVDELFSDIDPKLRIAKLNLPEGLNEIQLRQRMGALASQNAVPSKYAYFLGGGVYHHSISSPVWHLALRGEFFTAYTPYQPEFSQGILQAIYEWQSFISLLTGMDAANASVYDGASASGEMAVMLKNISKKKKILVSAALNPEYAHVLKTYAKNQFIEVIEIPLENGLTSLSFIQSHLDDSVAGVVVQYPNFLGSIEDLKSLSETVHAKGVLLGVCVNELVSLGMLKSPGELGADIVAGEAQSFGIPMGFGGPHAGFLAVKTPFLRALPGRLCGKTLDHEGNEGFILTLQAREQHIRREKATSSICTNQGLCALAASIQMSLLGEHGVREMAEINHARAAYAFDQIRAKGFSSPLNGPFFNEFVFQFKDAAAVKKHLLSKNMVAGIELGPHFPSLQNCLLFCVTDMNSKEQIDALVHALSEVKA